MNIKFILNSEIFRKCLLVNNVEIEYNKYKMILNCKYQLLFKLIPDSYWLWYLTSHNYIMGVKHFTSMNAPPHQLQTSVGETVILTYILCIPLCTKSHHR